MSDQTPLTLTAITHPAIDAYCSDYSAQESPTLRKIRLATEQRFPKVHHMITGGLVTAFFKSIIQSTGTHWVLEIGTFTGYSALAFAEALPVKGRVITLDRDPVALAFAQEYWAQSADGKKIESILGVASESLAQISQEISQGIRPKPELIFIDADKSQNLAYLEWAIQNIEPRGNIFIDNVLWKGKVIDPQDSATQHIYKLNEFIKSDPRLHAVILPLRDGLWWLRRAPSADN